MTAIRHRWRELRAAFRRCPECGAYGYDPTRPRCDVAGRCGECGVGL